ncbi:MAG: hypothetical protein HY567_02990, partial [Candidatus Kerfeldbacteria bacterium]|nr:hypothetical protein [Candidatus Kerfeldbacteria bacterium]
AEILDDSVASADILLDTIAAVDIAAGGVGTSEILDGTIADADTNGALTGASLAADTLVAGDIATGAVTTTEILDGTVAAGDIADVVRTISLPLYSFIECDTNAGTQIPFADGTNALPHFLNSATDGTGFVMRFDDTAATEDQGTEVCNNFTVPADYASGGEFRFRALKDAHAGATEVLTSAVSINGAALGATGSVTTSASASTTYTNTPTGTYAANDSVSMYLAITSGTTMDDIVDIASAEFAYTATQ